MEKFKISDIQELFATDVERFHSLTQAHVNELLTQTPPSQESLDEALRQAHTLKGLAATVEAWGLSCLGADLEKLLELAGSWMHNEPEKARGIFEFIIEHLQDWFVMNQFTCMDMLPEAWDIYQGLRATMDERWPGYLPAVSIGSAGDNQFVRLNELELGETEGTGQETEVRSQESGVRPPNAPLHVVPPVLRHRDQPTIPAEVENRDVQQSELISHSADLPSHSLTTAGPASPKPLQVVPPTLKSKGRTPAAPAAEHQTAESLLSAQAAAPVAPIAPENISVAVPPTVPPVVAQSVTPPAAAAAAPVAESHAAPPILRVAPPALKRRVKKVAAEPQPVESLLSSAPVVESTHTPTPVDVPPVVEPTLPPTVEPLVVAQSSSELPVVESAAVVPPLSEQPVSELQAIDQAATGPSDDDTALFAPPTSLPEGAHDAQSVLEVAAGKEFETKFLAAQKPAVDADLLEMLGQEVAGYLSELSANLTELAANLADEGHWEKTRRLFHTIKGTAATFHLDAISAPAKAAEAHCIVAIEDAHARTREAFETCVHRAGVVAKALALPFNELPLREALELGLARAAMQATESAGAETAALDPEMAGFFIRDARDQIEVIEQALLRWEKGENATEQVQAAQRGFHTIKGAGNSIGLTAVAQSVHEVEAFLEGVAAAGATGSKALFTFLFGAVDQLRQYLAELTKNTAAPWRNDWTTALRLLCAPEEDSGLKAADSKLTSAATVVQAALVGDAGDEESHTLRIDADRLYQLMNLIGEMVVDRSRLARKIEQLTSLHRALAERNLALTGAVQSFQKEFEFNLLQAKGQRPQSAVQGPESGVGAGDSGRGTQDAGLKSAPGEFSEIEFDRYDQFNVLARSLVEISHDLEHLNEEVSACLDSFTAENVQFTQTSQSLQSKVTSLSLVPVNTLFPRLQRAFRDALNVEGKEADLALAGGEALLDKVVVDKVYAPLLHLLRNAVAHGIEAAPAPGAESIREKLKKPVRGAVSLTATQMSNQIVIQIADDGAGVDAKAVRKRAIEKGWLPKEAPALTPEQVVHFIFQPGFSTAQKVTSVSGRGIGLDVVRKEIENLNGAVELKFEARKGSMWTLRLPLTLSISEAILADVRGTTFAFPLNFIESGLVLDAPTSCGADGREVYEIKESRVQSPQSGVGTSDSGLETPDSGLPISEWLPVVRLSKLFHMAGGEAAHDAESNKGLIVSVGDRRAIVVVDAVLTRQEIVIKQLDSVLSLHPLLNGATLDAEGRVIPILNLPTLLKFGEQQSNVALGSGAAGRDAKAKGRDPKAQLRVLIVDDSLSVRKVQERYLAELGCQVTAASDGLYALEKLRESEFDFVFTDLEMPRLNGYELITELRGNPAWALLPVVVISSRGADKYITKAMNLGATTFLSKPFTQEQLKQVLGHYARAGRAEALA